MYVFLKTLEWTKQTFYSLYESKILAVVQNLGKCGSSLSGDSM